MDRFAFPLTSCDSQRVTSETGASNDWCRKSPAASEYTFLLL